MAKKKTEISEDEKKAKKAKRMEALKNRPEGQRSNSKQIDLIDLGNGNTLKSFGYPVSAKREHVGVLVTTVIEDAKGNPISTSTSWVPGNLTIKAKKGHGVITGVKEKKDKDSSEEKTDVPEKETKKKSKKKED